MFKQVVQLIKANSKKHRWYYKKYYRWRDPAPFKSRHSTYQPICVSSGLRVLNCKPQVVHCLSLSCLKCFNTFSFVAMRVIDVIFEDECKEMKWFCILCLVVVGNPLSLAQKMNELMISTMPKTVLKVKDKVFFTIFFFIWNFSIKIFSYHNIAIFTFSPIHSLTWIYFSPTRWGNVILFWG